MVFNDCGNFLVAIISLTIFGLAASEKFGCPFVNDKYDLGKKTIKEPVYGSALDILAFSNVADFINLYNKVQKINADFIEKHLFNSLDDYLEFYNDYVSSSQKFDSFYKAYQPKFRPYENSVSFAVGLLDQIVSSLSKEYPTLSRNVFLAASQQEVYVSDEDLAKLSAKQYLQTERGKKINKIYAVLTFSLETRLGHILFDPTYGVSHPFVVMVDGKPAAKELPAANNVDERTKTKYEILPSDNSFITGKRSHPKSPKSHLETLTYVALPHCSVMDVTQKMNLVRHDRYLVKKFNNGRAEAGIYFDALPTPSAQVKEGKKYFDFIRAFYRAGPTEDHVDYRHISISKFASADAKTNETLSAEEKKFLDLIYTKIGFSSKDVQSRLERVYKIYQNQEFLKDSFLQLTNIFDLPVKGNTKDEIIDDGLVLMAFVPDASKTDETQDQTDAAQDADSKEADAKE